MTDSTLNPGDAVQTHTSAVRVVDAVKRYGKGSTAVVALDHVSVEFDEGQFSAIMGPSGSGKSTLMHVMAGLDSLDSGDIYIADVKSSELGEKQLTLLRRNRIGFIFQAFNLVPTLTAYENITLPLSLAGKKPDQEWVDTIIDIVDLRSRLSHRPTELSGGQQQRVAVARALAAKPAIVFADEPTGNLDSHSGGEVLAFLRRAADDFNQTIVMVTHDANAASYADRVVFLADGKITDDLVKPTTDAILDRFKAH